jgi:ankyrin repeat protein
MSLHDLVKNFSSAELIREKIVTGTDVNERDKLKRTALHMAAWSGNLEALQLLVRAGASLDAVANDGFTALHFGVQSSAPGAPDCIRFLVKKHKPLLHQRITKGNKTPLHLAAAKGIELNIIALLELGADVSSKSTAGQVPADLAQSPALKALFQAYQRLTPGACAKQQPEEEHADETSANKVEVNELAAVSATSMESSEKAAHARAPHPGYSSEAAAPVVAPSDCSSSSSNNHNSSSLSPSAAAAGAAGAAGKKRPLAEVVDSDSPGPCPGMDGSRYDHDSKQR